MKTPRSRLETGIMPLTSVPIRLFSMTVPLPLN
jgi:hypothetical protein